MSYLETLRAKPEGVRKRIALLVTTGVTVILIVLWGIGFRESLDTLATLETAPSPPQKSAGLSGNIARISLGAKTLWKDLRTIGESLSD